MSELKEEGKEELKEEIKEELKPVNKCSIYKTCKTILETLDGKFCSFCYEYCKKATPQYTKAYHDTEEDLCTCTHDGIFLLLLKLNLIYLYRGRNIF